MTTKLFKMFLASLFLGIGLVAEAQVTPQFLGRYSVGIYDEGAAEIVAYSPIKKRMYLTNGYANSLRIVDISNPSSPSFVDSIDLNYYGSDLTSVAVSGNMVAVAVIDSNGKLHPGKVVIFDLDGNFKSQVKVGANPDMVTFTPDGKKILVANEGEPEDYKYDPEGSVSIINVAGGAASVNQSHVSTASFVPFNSVTLDPRIKITGRLVDSSNTSMVVRNSTIAEDLEPEYITISDDSKTAWVTCQENNAIAVIDIDSAKVDAINACGYKDHSVIGNGLDGYNQGSTIDIDTARVLGMYQPDAIASFKVGSTTYIVSANEGDLRSDWGSVNNEEEDIRNSSIVLDTVKFGGAANVAYLKTNSQAGFGRLKISTKWGDFNNDGKMDSLFSFGGRSFSVWNGSTGALVWDSGDDFEQYLAAVNPTYFNASNSNNTKKNRSDDKGPEPEAITVGKILDSTYAFIGLERIGGVMIYNITNPNTPYFVNYFNTRSFAVAPSQSNLASVGDLGPESIVFIPKAESPNGKDLLLVANEVSGTIALIQLNGRSDFQLQILHSGDMESNIAATSDAPKYAAIVDKLEDEHVNNLTLSSGDNILPGPFMSSGEDGSLTSPLRSTASRYYSGTTSQLRGSVGRPDIAVMNIIGFNASALGNHEFDLGTSELNSQIGVDIRNSGADKRWVGAQFPFVSANMDFSADANLSYLFRDSILRDTDFKTSATITNNNQKRGIAPSIIIERNGEKIGVVGATTQILAAISSPGATTIKGIKANDMDTLAAILQPVIDTLIAREGVNKIILLSHLQQIQYEKLLATKLRKVDIIIAGGNHAITSDGNDRLLPGHTATEHYPILSTNLDGDPIAILNNASEWKYVGRFVCDFDATGKLITSTLDSTINGVYASDSTSVIACYGNYDSAFVSGTKGRDVKTICDAIQGVITAKDGNIFGKTNVYLEGRRTTVRTEETNFGNLSAQANLTAAQIVDPTVKVSIKNGGGIRSAIGEVYAVGGNVSLLPPAPNAAAGKNRGDISQLDIEGSLRFNNGLSVLSLTAANLKRVLEHGVNATAPGVTPGQFTQVAGVKFSFDRTLSSGNKIRNAAIIDSLGNYTDTLVWEGMVYGDTNRTINIVTLNYLAGGGDAYPFATLGTGRRNLYTGSDSATLRNASNWAAFANPGTEQDAFAEYMISRYGVTPFNIGDTAIQYDDRIQQIQSRQDDIFAPCKIYQTPHPKHKDLSVSDTLIACSEVNLRTRNNSLYNTRLWVDGDTSFTTKAALSGWYWIHENSPSFCKVDSVYVEMVNEVIPASIDTTLCNLTSGATQTLNLANVYNKAGYTFYANDKSTVISISNFIIDGSTRRITKIGNFVSKTGSSLRCPARINVYGAIQYDSLFANDTIFNTNRSKVSPDVRPKSFYKYLWSNNDSIRTTNLNVSGIQWLQVSTAEGCSSRDSFHYSRLNLRLPRTIRPVINTDFTINVSDSSNTNAWVVWNNGDTGYSAVYNISTAIDTIVATMYDAYGSVTARTIVRTTSLVPFNNTPAPMVVLDEEKNDIITLGEVNIYPNPSRSTLNISNNGMYTNYLVSDMAGRILLSGILNKDVTAVDLNTLSSGTYVIHIQGAADSKKAKFVKVD